MHSPPQALRKSQALKVDIHGRMGTGELTRLIAVNMTAVILNAC